MKYVSDCCGEDIERPYPMYDIGDPTPYCSKCHYRCTPVKASEAEHRSSDKNSVE